MTADQMNTDEPAAPETPAERLARALGTARVPADDVAEGGPVEA